MILGLQSTLMSCKFTKISLIFTCPFLNKTQTYSHYRRFKALSESKFNAPFGFEDNQDTKSAPPLPLPLKHSHKRTNKYNEAQVGWSCTVTKRFHWLQLQLQRKRKRNNFTRTWDQKAKRRRLRTGAKKRKGIGISMTNVATTLRRWNQEGSWCAYHARGVGMHWKSSHNTWYIITINI